MTSTVLTWNGIRSRWNLKWPSSRSGWLRVVVPLGLLLAVAVARVVAGPGYGLLPLLAVAPAAAGALAGPLYTLAVGAAAIGTEALLTEGFQTEALSHEQIRIALVVVVGVSGGGVVASYLRRRQDRQLTDVRGVADVTQRELLRPIPSQVGPIRLSAWYMSASSEANVGGDLYAAVNTEWGLRLIVGDAEGKGLPAVHMAATAMFAFRAAAHEEDKLSGVADRIEAALKHELDGDQFITAVLAEVCQDCSEMVLLNCGHPQPLRIGRDGPELVGPADGSLPLGLGSLAAVQREPITIPWNAGEPVLFYTDGLAEARDQTGTFFPLKESESIRRHANPETLVDRLSAEVSRYTDHQQHDDLALLLIWRHPQGGSRKVRRNPSRPVHHR